MAKLLQPQEIEVHYIIPSLKRALAASMKEKGLKQKAIAKLLQTEEAAISQYISKKRGNSVEFDQNIMGEINKAATSITDTSSFVREIQRLLRLVRGAGILCRVHKKYSKIPQQCYPGITTCFQITEDGHQKLCS